jgi:lipoprotein-anchoring transpeptidase ErfK/SrfK
MTTWEKNDFGRWGWNLRSHGQPTAYYIHTTPDDEHATAEGKEVFLDNSHGCVHLKPKERDMLIDAGVLKEGVEFEVRRYDEKGPP